MCVFKKKDKKDLRNSKQRAYFTEFSSTLACTTELPSPNMLVDGGATYFVNTLRKSKLTRETSMYHLTRLFKQPLKTT